MLECWGQYAPNITPDNVLATRILTPYEYTQALPNIKDGDIFIGSFSGTQALDRHFSYRSEIPGLYMAGSPVHPGGAISGGPGYIAAGVLAEDLGLKRWWPRIDLEQHAVALKRAGARLAAPAVT